MYSSCYGTSPVLVINLWLSFVVMEQIEGIRIASRAKDSSFDGKRTTKTTVDHREASD